MILNYQVELCIISFIVFIIMLMISKPWVSFKNPGLQSAKKGVNTFFIVFTLFNIFQFWARDYYSYYLGFEYLSQYTNELEDGYEEVYNWLAKVLNNNYHLWRTIIWGIASIFTYYTAKILDIRNRNLLVLLTLITAINNLDNVTRGVLGHTMLLFGAVLFVDKRSSTLTKIIGLTLVCVSYYFHKSMYVNIIFAFLALFPFGKKTVVLSLIAFPFLTTIATYLINGIASGELELALGEGVGGVGDRTVAYASGESMNFNINGVIRQIFGLIPEYLSIFYVLKKVFFEKCFNGISKGNLYKYLARLSFVCIYIGSLFAFVETSSWIYIRFKCMGFFPMVFVLTKLWTMEKNTNLYIKAIILFFVIDILFLYFYSIFITKTIYA